jgi:hypothetical protein
VGLFQPGGSAASARIFRALWERRPRRESSSLVGAAPSPRIFRASHNIIRPEGGPPTKMGLSQRDRHSPVGVFQPCESAAHGANLPGLVRAAPSPRIFRASHNQTSFGPRAGLPQRWASHNIIRPEGGPPTKTGLPQRASAQPGGNPPARWERRPRRESFWPCGSGALAANLWGHPERPFGPRRATCYTRLTR